MTSHLLTLSQPALVMWLLKATAILVVALMATAVLRRASAGSRHLVWLATLVSVLVLPGLSLWAPARLAILPSALTANPFATAQANPAPAAVEATRVKASVTSAPTAVGELASGQAIDDGPAGPLASKVAFPVWKTLLAIWGGVAFAFLAWLGFGALAVRRLVRLASPLNQAAWTAPLCEIADRLDLDAVPRLLASSHVEMPFACGILQPTIVLPASAEGWTGDRRRAVLFHELAHVKRRDLIGHTLGRFACAVYWFHPLVWTAARRLRAESERACDDLVLSCGARASDYADHLLDIVVSVRRHGAPAMAMPMARRRELEGRVLAILDPAVARVGPGRLQSAGLVAGLGVLVLSVAAMTPAPRAIKRAITAGPNVVAAAVDTIPSRVPGRQPEVRVPHDVVSDGVALSKVAPSAEVAPPPEPAVRRQEKATPATVQSDSQRVALLARVLRTDTDASVRRAAAWGLSDVHDRAPAIDALLEALRRDEDGNVREMAAWALASSSRDDVLRALAEALRRDAVAEVRETAAWALGNNGAREHIDALEKAMTDESDEVRETAAWALGQLTRRPASRTLVAALSDQAPEVRETAAWALAEIEDSGTAAALTEAFLKETNSDVRMAELRALTFLGDQNKAVLDMALASKDAELRARAVRMLAGGGAGMWPQPRPRPRPRPSP
jgi:beta-lactamase regulating signal transducer with metallopeptidase domain